MKFESWIPRLTAVTAMVRDDLTDEQIGNVYGVTRQMIYRVRKHFGIERTPARKPPPASVVLPAPELPVVNGVKKCPTRWLEGAGSGPTARGRRG